MVLEKNFSESNSPQFSRTFLSTLADLSNADVLIVSTCFLISMSTSPFTFPFEIVPSAPITIVFNVILDF